MSSLVDCRFDALRTSGNVGSTSDMLRTWLVSEGANPADGNHISDLWRSMLASKGFTGQLNDAWYAYLGSLGHVGSINDREKLFWCGGTPPITDIGPWDYMLAPVVSIPKLVWSSDFLLTIEAFLPSAITTEQWLLSDWDQGVGGNAIAVRVKSGNIEVFISTDGGAIASQFTVRALPLVVNYISLDVTTSGAIVTVNGLEQELAYPGVPFTSTGGTFIGNKNGASLPFTNAVRRVTYVNRAVGGDDRDYNFDGALTTLVDSVSGQDGTMTGAGLHEFTLDVPTGVITDSTTLTEYEDPLKQDAFELYPIIGQSNAVGRADIVPGIDDVYTAVSGRVLQKGRLLGIEPATNPLKHSGAFAGDMGFWLNCFNQTSGNALLVPAAVGGTGFIDNRWNQGDDIYNQAIDAIDRASLASNYVRPAKAIFWLQGENDADTFNANYLADLQAMRLAMIDDTLSVTTDTPWIVIEIKGSTSPANVPLINADLAAFAASIPNGAIVTTQDLTIADTWHYDAPSLREIGNRCYTKLVELIPTA